MTDQELLERAARAAGIEVELYTGDGPFNGKLRRRVIPEPPEPGSKWKVWNPLDDDGDAFRLAQRLSLNVAFKDGYGGGASQAENEIECIEVDKLIPLSATRRAIVRAAAALGERGDA